RTAAAPPSRPTRRSGRATGRHAGAHARSLESRMAEAATATRAPATGKNTPQPGLEVRDLKKHFDIRHGFLRRAGGVVLAVDGGSFTIARREALGLVGESGCGKSTVGRTILRLIEPTAGTIVLDGRDITHLDKAALRPFRPQMQIIFQDPFS